MKKHKLSKGYDIRLVGESQKTVVDTEKPQLFAIQPPDFPGLNPRLEVEEGAKVKIGSVLITDKKTPEIRLVSPASGEVVQVNRGDRRAILEVVVESDNKDDAEFFGTFDRKKIAATGRDELIKIMLESGVWPVVRQRPFSRIASPSAKPRDIFICGMDSAPLAPDYNLLMDGLEEPFQIGVDVLKQLTEGQIYLSVDAKKGLCPAFQNAEGVEIHEFTGPHPAGNISVHIYHIKPIKVGDIVWYIYAPDVAVIGMLFQKGRFPVERIVAVAGSSVNEDTRKYYRTRVGASLQSLLTEGQLLDEDVRYISGNVLQGRILKPGGYLGFYSRLLTVIPDNQNRELFGWLTPGLSEESHSRLFLSKLIPNKRFVKDTRLHGGHRAFIQTGEYEKMLPMDIYPMHLVKSIMAEEIEDMIALGLLEVDEEDFALCSYICPSKIDFGTHIRNGLNILEHEG
jgi:Na+-transporting NADH:ubiquinone oxidoreductase subunit A